MVDVGITIAGAAGQGIQLVSDLLGRLLARSGREVFSCQDVMSRIRGGHNFARLRVRSVPVLAPADRDNLLVCLRPGFAGWHIGRLAADGVAVCEPGEGNPSDPRVVQLPMGELAAEAGGSAVMSNVVALGVVAGIFGMESAEVRLGLEHRFGAGDGARLRQNLDCFAAGFDAARRLGIASRLMLPKPGPDRRIFVAGSQALALGAIAGNVRVVAGYPMSPGTPVLEFCSRHAEAAGLVVEYTEDEVAAVNLALGASFAGARAMVATSGGGFSLMNEGLSLAGMTETPLVVMLGMRPGPATGMATRTAQADLLTALFAGHGDFGRVVLAPADGAAAFRCAAQAFELADQYQLPVIVLFDQLLGDAGFSVSGFPVVEPPVDRFADAELEKAGFDSYRRYAPGPEGVSIRIRPGTHNQLVYADSDEHDTEGHITESAEMRKLMVEKRAAKLAALLARAPAPAPLPAPAETLVWCFGSSVGIVTEAVERLRDAGKSVALVPVEWLWPFPAAAAAELCRHRQVFTVEANHTGQLARLLAQEALVKVAGSVRRYDGRPFAVSEVVEGIAEMMGRQT